MLTILLTLYWAIALALAAVVGYLLLLTLAAWVARRRTSLRELSPTNRFLFLIPAHNEEQLLPELLASLQRLEYPHELYAIHVVADNCSDATAVLARQGGATVHERFDTERIGKGYALQWLLQRIWAAGEPHDAIVILDADTLVSPNFLKVMDARLARGERAIQAYYAVRTPDGSWGASLRAIALAAYNYLRPLGRMTFGWSAGLKGNGMVFAADLSRRYPWPASLTEDVEYHMALILGGECVIFAPDAQVWAEMPATLAASRSQQNRWERGRIEMAGRYVPRLLREALARRSLLLLDAALEQLIPPFSLVAAVNVVLMGAALALGDRNAILASLVLAVAQAIYIGSGLVLARVPRRIWLSLLYAPVFIVWKLWIYALALFNRRPSAWVRTARNR